ncbi:phosphoribosylanthranilate isomerase [Enterococcus hirae]|nr:phosphoribosylanthranilate isomerase [Enterococcus hirae]
MVKVKICGLSTHTAVDTAVNAGADFLGFVLAKSPRQVTIEQAAALTNGLPAEIKKIAVFANAAREEIDRALAAGIFDGIQLHGVLPDLTGLETMTIIAQNVAKNYAFPEIGDGQYLLLDAPPQKYLGGNGQPFVWKDIRPEKEKMRRTFVAGGLTPENVRAAVRYFAPFAVDVSSGVETGGKKDLEKIKRFIQNAKG